MAKKRRKERQAKAPSLPLSNELVEAIEGWAEEAAAVHDLELYDVVASSAGGWSVQVFLDRPDAEPGTGVAVEDCARVSRYMEALLDADERVPERYVLEVSSPGVERKLKKPKHFSQAIGSDVVLVVREQIDGQNKVSGRLVAFEDDTLTVEMDGTPVTIPLDGVSRAKLTFDFSGAKQR
ncbi:ribosome maturation factor RimP [Lujinxingia litoralis]|uniref:ribosome maturation factor RimP n=1 Tax=Lujinxingia litoralis TaxID=2211119 RepID=UPI001314D8C1|nr:ribosome maturation factor RimP [Lujinxingia litoralis]